MKELHPSPFYPQGDFMGQTKEILLIVDDSKFQRAVLKELLQPSFDLIEAATGEECLDLIEHSGDRITMVLLDLVMPGIDGFEVLRRRQQMPVFQDIPVIVLTTSNSDAFQTEAFELGADEFIIKPVDDRVALTRINNILDARRKVQSLLKKQQKLQTMTEIDPMTRLLNKSTTEHIVTKILQAEPDRRHAMLMIDIDNFKAVNDQLGHKMGDHVITVVAGVISSQFDDTNYVGRMGGDEFVVFVRDAGSKEAVRKKAYDLVRAVWNKNNLTIPENISLSVGLVFTDGSEQSYPELFNKADQALYQAKKAGKNRYYEYGSQLPGSESETSVLVWTESRNICSTLEYAYHQPIRLEEIHNPENIRVRLYHKEVQILAVYVDVSEQTDDGEQIWNTLKSETWIGKIPLIAICQEGNLRQVRHAIESNIIDDLLFAPLDAESVTRRARAMDLIG